METRETKILPTDSPKALKDACRLAIDQLLDGQAVVLPTETVYGLAAAALRPEAVAKIYEIKDRPSFDPLIVHLPSKTTRHWLDELTHVDEALKKSVARLIQHFWPGPLTLLLPKSERVPDIVTAGLPEVALRCSAHPIFSKVVDEFDSPLAAPSANLFGRISPTSAPSAEKELSGRVELILDGGASSHGLESTIIRLLPPEREGGKERAQILRPGPITPEALKKFVKVILPSEKNGTDAPEVPGQLDSHYAPSTPLTLCHNPEDLSFIEGKRYGLLSFRGEGKGSLVEAHPWAKVEVLSPGKGKLPEAAVRFFHLLRDLDEADLDAIVAEALPMRGLGLAMMDRLKRAAGPAI